MEFIWKWAVSIVLDAAIAIAAVAFFEGHTSGSGLGILALAGAGLLFVMIVGALLWLRVGGDDLSGAAIAVIVLVVLVVIAAGGVGWGWMKSVVETDWRFWLAAIALPTVAALQVALGHVGRARPTP